MVTYGMDSDVVQQGGETVQETAKAVPRQY
jgi:hypothetical protein